MRKTPSFIVINEGFNALIFRHPTQLANCVVVHIPSITRPAALSIEKIYLDFAAFHGIMIV